MAHPKGKTTVFDIIKQRDNKQHFIHSSITPIFTPEKQHSDCISDLQSVTKYYGNFKKCI